MNDVSSRFQPVSGLASRVTKAAQAHRFPAQCFRGFRAQHLRPSRRAFSLIEVMIATAVTLLMMLGLAQIFRVLGESMSQGRSALELNNRLRSVVHRIRTDLDNVTVTPRNLPLKFGTAQGYLKYYEGPCSDYTFASEPRLNRFGDMDDIFMATVKAKDAWFTGKVPRFIAEKRAPTSAAELQDLVTIASQYAEVVIFAQPLVAAGSPVDYTGPQSLLDRDPSFLASHPNHFERMSLPNLIEQPPAGYRLHYRVLLIRPDLNLPSVPSVTPARLPALPNADVMVARPQALNGQTLPSPTCDMYLIHQYCDLSIRRIYDTNDGLAAGWDYVAANDLQDLTSNPVNRFAHVVYPVSNNIISMPALALGQTMPFQKIKFYVPEDRRLSSELSPSPIAPANNSVGGGFLHPAFVLFGDRTGEDVLADDVLAFDIKVFDSSAPIVFHRTVDNEQLSLRPSDPGFAMAMSPGLLSNSTEPLSRVESRGEFVDANWGGMLLNHYEAEFTALVSNATARKNVLISEFSGVQEQKTANPPDALFPSDSLLKSGAVLLPTSTSPLLFYQIAVDTFTDWFENDGVHQRELIFNHGRIQDLNPPIGTVVDAGVADNDPTLNETSPPFPVDLRGLQISVRLEDRASKQFKQMSTVKEFVSY
ncbi:MAG: prepilin-type N-terminal cleavage/methylation domain-containing protein [Pirellulaceae bacterium]|nr:prepilin-type N-terminal cleavage/methylation domain-containing protein [Pirellulaceae bacterium]